MTAGQPRRSISLVVAVDRQWGIGIKGSLPWRLPGDMQFFKKLTSSVTSMGLCAENVVIMGRKTWESIPARFRPLPDRLNVVLSRNPSFALQLPVGIRACTSLMDAINAYSDRDVFIIGGSQIYREALELGICDRLYVTHVDANYDCDAFFPKLPGYGYRLLSDDETEIELEWAKPLERSDAGVNYRFFIYTRSNQRSL